MEHRPSGAFATPQDPRFLDSSPPDPPASHPSEGGAGGLLRELYEAFARRSAGDDLTLPEWIEIAERWRILRALREARGNRSETARRLGIGRRTLYSKMERLGIGPGDGA